MRRLLCLAALAAAMLLRPGGAEADEITERAARLTGIDTPESQAADADVAKLLVSYDRLIAQFSATKDRSKSRYLDEARQTMDRALARAREAADRRANAIVGRQCLASPASAAANADSAFSPYLCSAVRQADGSNNPNDPWVVCACAHQYLLGVEQEIAAIRQRARSYVGQSLPSALDNYADYPSPPLTPDEIAKAFGRDGPLDTDGWITAADAASFASLARQTQRELARLEILSHEPGAPTPATSFFQSSFGRTVAALQPAKREAYHRVQQAVALLWALARKEARYALLIAEEALHRRQAVAYADFKSKWLAINEAFEAKWPVYERDAHSAELRQALAGLCSASDAAAAPVIDEAVGRARLIASSLYDTRRRLVADTEAWKAFGLKDGAGTTVEPGLWNYRDEDFARFITETFVLEPVLPLPLSAGDPQTAALMFQVPPFHQPVLDEPRCVEFGYLMADPSAGYPRDAYDRQAWDAYSQRVLAAVRQYYPEAVAAGGDSGMWLRFPVPSAGEEEQRIVSGAGTGESP